MILSPSLSAEALGRLSPRERLALLREQVQDSLEAMARAARVFEAMEAAGDDLSAVPRHLSRILRAINARTLLPEVAVRFGGVLRQRVGLLPLSWQRSLTAPGARVTLALPDGTEAELPPDSLSRRQIEQVFAPGAVRTVDEQRSYLSRNRIGFQPAAPAPRRPRPGRPPLDEVISIDPDGLGLRIGGVHLTTARLEELLQAALEKQRDQLSARLDGRRAAIQSSQP